MYQRAFNVRTAIRNISAQINSIRKKEEEIKSKKKMCTQSEIVHWKREENTDVSKNETQTE